MCRLVSTGQQGLGVVTCDAVLPRLFEVQKSGRGSVDTVSMAEKGISVFMVDDTGARYLENVGRGRKHLNGL